MQSNINSAKFHGSNQELQPYGLLQGNNVFAVSPGLGSDVKRGNTANQANRPNRAN